LTLESAHSKRHVFTFLSTVSTSLDYDDFPGNRNFSPDCERGAR
jgi:hypothetical protein